MYLRYVGPTRLNRNWIWYATHAVIWFNLLYSVALILVVLLQCVGKHPAPGESCVNENMVLVGASVINVLTDLMVLVIPVAAVSRMQMARRTKLGVLVVFAVGGL
jgi:preprotein translocase subunit SecG